MDTTIRNLRRETYLAARARAVLKGKTVGELISNAIDYYLALPDPELDRDKRGSFFDLPCYDLGSKNKTLSTDIDQILY